MVVEIACTLCIGIAVKSKASITNIEKALKKGFFMPFSSMSFIGNQKKCENVLERIPSSVLPTQATS
jgi:hypothetical protein